MYVKTVFAYQQLKQLNPCVKIHLCVRKVFICKKI